MDKKERDRDNGGRRLITRREFLQWTGVAGAAWLLSPALGRFRDIDSVAASQGPDQPEWIYTVCHMCGGSSGLKVRVEDGVVKKIEGNEFNPIGLANIYSDFRAEQERGARVCPKGNAAVKSLYDPDRLKTPLVRTGERGEGKWREVSWEEAIDLVATRLQEVKEAHGPEALLWFTEDASFTNLQSDFCKCYGTPNFSMHSNLCDVSRKAGFKLVMGHDRPLPDFQNTKYALLFGWNPLGATKWIHLPAIINRGREKGMKLVVVDPVCSQTAAKADEWIPLRPGTDGALALALANVLIAEDLCDSQFVERWVVGMEEFRAYVADKTPEWAEQITSVPAETIRRIAREMAANRPCVIDAWSGPGHHTNATQGTRAIAALAALLGMYDVPGSMILPERKGGKARALNVDKPAKPRVDGVLDRFPFAHASGIYTEIREAILTGQPYQPQAAVVIFQNLLMSIPNRQKTLEALKKLDLIVCVDLLMSETAQMADIVIPGSHFLERWDIYSNWVTFPAVSVRQPVVQSWIAGMTEPDFLMAVARKMGLNDKDGKGFDMSYRDYLDAELKAGIGIGMDDLLALPGCVWIGGGTHYRKHETAVTPPEGATVDPKTGVVKGADGKAIGVKIGEDVLQGFATPSRRIELYSQQMKDKGYDPLPAYSPPADAPSQDFPLYLVGWKQAEHTHSRTFNNVWLMEMKPNNPLFINQGTAERLGLAEGDEVLIESPFARAKGTVHLTQGIHPEVVGLHHGYGHWALGKVAKGKGTDDAQFLPGKSDPICGQAVTKEVGVRVSRT